MSAKSLCCLMAAGLLPAVLGVSLLTADDSGPQPVVSRQSDGDMIVQLAVPAGQYQRVESSADGQSWAALATVASNGTAAYRDSGAGYQSRRFYRFVSLTGTGVFTGDHIRTSAGDAVIHPVNHASVVIQWNGKTIYCDPVGASSLYTGIPPADLILVTHSHGDHFSSTTLNAVRRTSGTVIVAPQAVYNSMSATLKGFTSIMANNTSLATTGLTIEAIPAYNSNHALGTGNGYILNIGGKRLYFSGDTGDIPEMRSLTNIDAAFVCMNIPFTMTVTSAASAVRQFRPKIVYPYHYRNQDNSLSDLALFESLVSSDAGIEVRPRAWY